MVDLVILVFHGMGPCVAWFANGRGTSYVEELAERYKRWNSLVAMFLFCMLFGLAIYINN